jgi:uncharacterized membrane protein YhhN
MSVLVLLGLGLGLAYLPLAGRDPSALRSLVKTLPVTLFAGAALGAGAPLLALALALSAAGDLALSRPGRLAFPLGLAAFALAHLAYLAVFLGLNPGAWPPLWAALPVLALAASTELWLAPQTGALKPAVRLYTLLIALMALAALPLLPLAIPFGAVLFLGSDFLLAVQTFRLGGRGPGWIGPAIWALYLAAQALIVIGAAALPIPGWSV